MHFLDQLDELKKPVVNKKPWMEEVEFILATKETLSQIEEECLKTKRCALDLETTGLDQRAFPNDSGRLETVSKIVGFCFAATPKRGYYIPVRHRGIGAEANVPPRLVVDMINRLQEAGVLFIFHNAKFDQKFLECEPAGRAGDWDDPKTWECSLILAYLRNSRERQKGLKYLSKKSPDEEYPGLGREMIELEELFPKEKGVAEGKDFSTLDPTWEPVLWYAASDAICTLALFDLIYPVVLNKDKFGNSQKTIYTVEKICQTSTRWMEQCRIHIDKKRLVELIQKGQEEWFQCLEKVYLEVGETLDRDIRPPWMKLMGSVFDYKILSPDYMEVRAQVMREAPQDLRPPVTKSVPSLIDPKTRESVQFKASYDITIPAELGLMLRELGLQGLKATEKSGQVQTSKDVLEEVIEKAGDKYPWMRNVKRFREISKALGSTLFCIYEGLSTERSPDGCVWAGFNGWKVDTGRFATPAPQEKNFMGQVGWNVHSTTANRYDPKDPPPECVYRQREVISAREGYILLAIDYSGVELRIVTNLSGEPKWTTEFFRCSGCDHEFPRDHLPPPFCPECGSDKIGDMHTLTALSVFGEDIKKDKTLFKLRRNDSKGINFGLCYGGSGNAVQNAIGCDKEEGWRIKNQFDKTYKGLLKWWQGQHQLAKKQKYVSTAFGRRYPLPDVDSEIGGFRAKAERNAVNGPVQGTSADIMKLAMGLLYREFKKRGWVGRGPGLKDLVLMTITIHDELVFEVHESVVGEAIPVIERVMCDDSAKNLGWIIPLKVDIEFGYGDRNSWITPYNLTEMAWNHEKAGKDWTPHLASILPTYYENYLRCGGKPVGVEVDKPPPTGSAPPPPASSSPPSSTPPPLDGESLLNTPPVEPEGAVEEKKVLQPAPRVERVERAVAPAPVEKEGTDYVYRVAYNRLTAEVAEKLARVVSRCLGRGVDVLRILDENGADLIGGPVKVAYQEFIVLARYEGV